LAKEAFRIFYCWSCSRDHFWQASLSPTVLVKNLLLGTAALLLLTGCAMFSFAEETIEASQEVAFIGGLAALGAIFGPLGAATGAAFGWFGTDSAGKAEVIKDLKGQLGKMQQKNDAIEGAAQVGGFFTNNFGTLIGALVILLVLFWMIPAPKITNKKVEVPK